MKKLLAAHKKAAKARRDLSIAIAEQFQAGTIASHNKGCKLGNWIRVTVEMTSFDRVKVWNPRTEKSHWVHYFHFLPRGS